MLLAVPAVVGGLRLSLGLLLFLRRGVVSGGIIALVRRDVVRVGVYFLSKPVFIMVLAVHAVGVIRSGTLCVDIVCLFDRIIIFGLVH